MVKVYIPKRGDICWIHFNNSQGHEQKGRRPALVVSPYMYNKKSGLSLVCPITSIQKNHPFEVPLINTKTKGVILVDHIKSFSVTNRKFSFIERATKNVTDEAIGKLLSLIS